MSDVHKLSLLSMRKGSHGILLKMIKNNISSLLLYFVFSSASGGHSYTQVYILYFINIISSYLTSTKSQVMLRVTFLCKYEDIRYITILIRRQKQVGYATL